LTGQIFSGGKPQKAARSMPLQGGSASPPPEPTGRVARLIAAYLKGILPRPETPKLIALAISEKQGTVRKEIHRMEERGQVINVRGTGWYRLWLDPGVLALAEKPEPCVHAIQMTTVAPLSGGLPVPRGALQAVLNAGAGWAPNKADKSAVRTEWVRGRAVTLQSFTTGTVLISVSATSAPISYAEWAEFWSELKGFARAFNMDLASPVTHLTCIEFNVDWRAYFLSGVKRMKVSTFSRAWGQIYQKHRDALRIELRVAPTEMTAGEGARIIAELAGSFARAPPMLPPSPDPLGPEVA
jgi:hypothetical protein